MRSSLYSDLRGVGKRLRGKIRVCLIQGSRADRNRNGGWHGRSRSQTPNALRFVRPWGVAALSMTPASRFSPWVLQRNLVGALACRRGIVLFHAAITSGWIYIACIREESLVRSPLWCGFWLLIGAALLTVVPMRLLRAKARATEAYRANRALMEQLSDSGKLE